MSSKLQGYVWDACAVSGVKGTRLMVMVRLADYSSDDGKSYPGIKTIARQIGAGESTIRTAIAELEAEKWLRRENRRNGNRNTSNMYFLNVEKLEEIALRERSAIRKERCKNSRFDPSDSDASNSDASDFDPSDSDQSEMSASSALDPSDSDKKGVLTRQNLTPDPQGLKHDPQVNSKHESQDIGASAGAPAPTRSAKQDYSTEFETAWQAYPKRAGGNSKSAAFKAWKARLKDGVRPEDMLEGVKRYAAYCRATGNTGTQFVKQAATFFGPDRHFEESWQTPSAPGGGRCNALPVSGFSGQDYGESGCNWGTGSI